MANLSAIRTATEARGLLREAARRYKSAALTGDAKAAACLVRCWDQAHPGNPHAARWAAENAPVDDPAADAYLLRVLHHVGAAAEARHLAGRAAAGTSLAPPRSIADLITVLRETGEEDRIRQLADRGADLARLDNPRTGVEPPAVLREAAERAARVPVPPVTPDDRLDDPVEIAVRLHELPETSEPGQAHLLAGRASAVIAIDNPFFVAEVLSELRQLEATDAATRLLSRDPARHVRLDRPFGVRDLLTEFHEAGTEGQARLLAHRTAEETPAEILAGSSNVAALLHGLWHARAREQVRLLADRTVSQIPLKDTGSIAQILDILVEADAQPQAAALLSRDLGTQVPPGNPQTAAALLAALRKAGADRQAEALTQRLPQAGLFDLFRQQPGNAWLYQFGREEDGRPAPPWNWDDI